MAPNDPRRRLEPAEIEAIRRRMAGIRREIQADVNVAAEHLNATMDWRGYVRSYPWLAAGAVAGAGFVAAWLLVPRHRIRVMERDEAEQARPRPRYEQRVEERAEEKAERKGWMSMALGFLAPIAMRAAQNYAIKFVEGRLAESQFAGFMPEEPDHVQPDR